MEDIEGACGQLVIKSNNNNGESSSSNANNDNGSSSKNNGSNSNNNNNNNNTTENIPDVEDLCNTPKPPNDNKNETQSESFWGRVFGMFF